MYPDLPKYKCCCLLTARVKAPQGIKWGKFPIRKVKDLISFPSLSLVSQVFTFSATKIIHQFLGPFVYMYPVSDFRAIRYKRQYTSLKG